MASGYETGELGIFEVGKPGKEKFAKRVALFQTKKKVRVLGWSNVRKEVFLGDEEGIITIFNGKQGMSICISYSLIIPRCSEGSSPGHQRPALA